MTHGHQVTKPRFARMQATCRSRTISVRFTRSTRLRRPRRAQGLAVSPAYSVWGVQWDRLDRRLFLVRCILAVPDQTQIEVRGLPCPLALGMLMWSVQTGHRGPGRAVRTARPLMRCGGAAQLACLRPGSSSDHRYRGQGQPLEQFVLQPLCPTTPPSNEGLEHSTHLL